MTLYSDIFIDWPVGLVVRDPDCKARGHGFDSQPGQIFVVFVLCLVVIIYICMYLKHIKYVYQ